MYTAVEKGKNLSYWQARALNKHLGASLRLHTCYYDYDYEYYHPFEGNVT